MALPERRQRKPERVANTKGGFAVMPMCSTTRPSVSLLQRHADRRSQSKSSPSVRPNSQSGPRQSVRPRQPASVRCPARHDRCISRHRAAGQVRKLPAYPLGRIITTQSSQTPTPPMRCALVVCGCRRSSPQRRAGGAKEKETTVSRKKIGSSVVPGVDMYVM